MPQVVDVVPHLALAVHVAYGLETQLVADVMDLLEERIASRIDDQYELVAGALSSTAEKSRRSGQALGTTNVQSIISRI